MALKKKNKKTIGIDEYIKANKAVSRLEEHERNGGRWVAKDRPHKNKKKYDRKRDRRVSFDGLSYLNTDYCLSTCFIYFNTFSNIDCTTISDICRYI